MQSTHLIDNLAALRAISQPLRMEIIRELRSGPRTVAQVAAALGQSATKLHYHVGELEQHGLLRVVETRQKGNLVEKLYGNVAEFFRVDPLLFASETEGLEAFYANVTGILDTTAAELRHAIREGRITSREGAASLRTLVRLELEPDQVEELGKRLQAVVQEFAEKTRPGVGTGAALTMLMVPLAAPAETHHDSPNDGKGPQ